MLTNVHKVRQLAKYLLINLVLYQSVRDRLGQNLLLHKQLLLTVELFLRYDWTYFTLHSEYQIEQRIYKMVPPRIKFSFAHLVFVLLQILAAITWQKAQFQKVYQHY